MCYNQGHKERHEVEGAEGGRHPRLENVVTTHTLQAGPWRQKKLSFTNLVSTMAYSLTCINLLFSSNEMTGQIMKLFRVHPIENFAENNENAQEHQWLVPVFVLPQPSAGQHHQLPLCQCPSRHPPATVAYRKKHSSS